MDPYEYRRQNFTLSEDDETVREAFAEFFEKESPVTRARDAEPLGFDSELWQLGVEMGLTSMALSEEAGGDGAGLIEMALVAEEFGRSLAPIPLIEHVVATRLLAAAGDPAHADLLAAAIAGERIIAFVPRPLAGRQIVHTAAIAQDLVTFDGDELVLVSADGARAHVVNEASLPFAWVDTTAEQVIKIEASDPAALFETAGREWRILTASALVGLTAASLELGVEFAKTRETMGTLIGKLQGVQFPLADVHMWITGARNLVRRAAWFHETEPEAEQSLAYEALVYATEAAVKGTSIAAHVQGGLGFIGESDASLYFLRAKGWAHAAGSVSAELRTAGEIALTQRRAKRDVETREPAGLIGAAL
ncbi:acyl-CoA dehydrogenase family protein [Microbacterium sp.]|uniref:acyl-CoA dehydrogenase family protein n=1 Tax=Microbacterium sp. TaxID=51671 RepID=UPI0027372E86|nr:acyl-CoA dehydrogenase family protein [Microbacterium sp.]MDP3950266.1 acyl-CoA dehydrogenase family protein [Microbacterium sp.]